MKIISHILLTFVSFATDHRLDAGKFRNTSNKILYCYGDSASSNQICKIPVKKGETCLGDAIGPGDGKNVFKVPNKTTWYCTRSAYAPEAICLPRSDYDLLMLVGASLKNGIHKYYQMDFEHFSKIMGNKSVVECNSNNEPITGIPTWIPEIQTETICH